jgi:hypothetical protein
MGGGGWLVPNTQTPATLDHCENGLLVKKGTVRPDKKLKKLNI